jgi:nucleoid-associated protein YgaU
MRKDLRIGLGIGGVLLAVLIVSLVVRSNNQKKQETQAIAQGQDDSPNPYGEDPAATADPAAQTPGGPADPTAPQMPPLPKVDGAPAAGPEDGSDPWVKPDASVASATGTPRDWNMILARERSENPAPGAPRTTPPPVVPPPSDLRQAPDSSPTAANARIPRGDTAGTGTVGSSLFTASRTPGERNYVVKSGDTLISIARAQYGNPRLYLQIMKANPGVEPETMKPGTKLVLPELSAAQASRRTNGGGTGTGNGNGTSNAIDAVTAGANAGMRPVDPKLEYRIQSGDSLARISQRLYGAENKVEALYNANREAIGPDREKLKLGMVLRLPEPPTSTASR